MESSFVESHRAEQPHSIEHLAVVAVDKIERFPMDSKLVVGFAVAIYIICTKKITITFHTITTTKTTANFTYVILLSVFYYN